MSQHHGPMKPTKKRTQAELTLVSFLGPPCQTNIWLGVPSPKESPLSHRFRMRVSTVVVVEDSSGVVSGVFSCVFSGMFEVRAFVERVWEGKRLGGLEVVGTGVDGVLGLRLPLKIEGKTRNC